MNGSDGQLCREYKVVSIRAGRSETLSRQLALESTMTLYLNGVELIYLLCLPVDLEYLALGFLSTEAIIQSLDDVHEVFVTENPPKVSITTKHPETLSKNIFMKRTITSGCGKGVVFRNLADATRPRIESDFIISAGGIETVWAEIRSLDELYRRTRGVHSAALCMDGRVQYFSADIGRHNTLDRIAGYCLKHDIPTRNCMIVSSGRFSSEMIFKLGALGIPVAVSRSAPTGLAVELAEDMGITIASAATPRDLTVYSQSWRILPETE